MPRLDGKVDLRVADWQTLSTMLPGARLDGEAALSLELGSHQQDANGPVPSPEPQKADQPVQVQHNLPQSSWAQQVSLRWLVPRLAYKAEKDSAVDVRGLEGEAVLTDAFGKGQLAARLDLAAVRSGSIQP